MVKLGGSAPGIARQATALVGFTVAVPVTKKVGMPSVGLVSIAHDVTFYLL